MSTWMFHKFKTPYPDFIHDFIHSFSRPASKITAEPIQILSFYHFINLDEIFDADMNAEPTMAAAAAAACAGHGCCMHSFAAPGPAGPVGGGMLGSSGNSSATPSPPETPMMPPSSMFREMPPTYLQVM